MLQALPASQPALGQGRLQRQIRRAFCGRPLLTSSQATTAVLRPAAGVRIPLSQKVRSPWSASYWPCATHWTVCRPMERGRGASGNRTDAEPSPHPDIEMIGELAARMRCDIDPDKHPLIREYCRRKTHGTFLHRKIVLMLPTGNMKIKNRSNLLFYVLNGHLDVWRQRKRMDGNSSTEANRLPVRAAGRASPVGAQWRLPHSARSSPLAFWTASGMPSEGVARN
jgi:hypothetical protein